MKSTMNRGLGLALAALLLLLLLTVGCASHSVHLEQESQSADIKRIRDTLQLYAVFLDDGRLEDYLDLYTDDAVFTAADVVYTGRDEIRRELAEKPRGPGMHLTLPAVIEMVSATEARTYSDFLRIRLAPEDAPVPWLITHVGRYYDYLVKGEDGRWRFSRRDIRLTNGVNRHELVEPGFPR